MNKFLKIATTALATAAVILIVSAPEIYAASALEGLKLWALVVLPTLLPFFFITALLSLLGFTDLLATAFGKPFSKIFRVGGIASYVFLMSVLSGYPVGAKIIADLRKNDLVSKDEATRISTFCSTSGPLFIIGSVGVGMFGDKRIGVALFVSHVLAALTVGTVFRFYGKDEISLVSPLKKDAPKNVLYECVYSSVISVAVVGGFICVFYTFADMLENVGATAPVAFLANLFLKDEKLSSALASGLIECTRGCRDAAAVGASVKSVCVAEGLISFGGVSVIAQSVAFLSTAEVKTGVFLLAKVLQTVVSVLICSLILNAFF